jgi:aminoglycoside phosphotransferase (APT) family kinase protein
MIDLRKEIGTVTDITARFFNEPVVEVSPLVGKGSVNQVFIVTTGQTKVVVRLSERREAFAEYEKEAWCIERAARRGVSVPVVLKVGRWAEHAYMIQPYIAGHEGRDTTQPRAYLWRELGRYARLIHGIEVAGFGLALSDLTDGDARTAWLKYLDYNIESLTADDELLKLNVLTGAQAKLIRSIFTGLKERAFSFGLNHGDLSLKNVIVEADGKVCLLDWGSAEAGIVPHLDLIQLLKMNMLENDPTVAELQEFVAGYGLAQVEFARLLPELESMLLLRAFDKLRWALEWNRQALDGFVAHARQAVARCLR